VLLRQTRVDGFIEHWHQDSEILGHYQVSLLLGIYKLNNKEEPVKKGLATSASACSEVFKSVVRALM
jgi:hypothetical protein